MIILDKKSCELVSHLLSLEKPETVMAISKKLNQSRRKVYYHLEKINEALPDGIDKIVSYPRVGILLTNEQKQVCQDLLDQLDDYTYVMSVEERIQLTMTYIAVSKERVTIDKLMQLNDVSRNTVLSDLNDIRQMLAVEDYDIQLNVTKADGYYLKCHPLSKIQYLYRLLYAIYTEGNKNFVEIVRDKIVDVTGFNRYFSEEVNAYIEDQLTNAQESLGKQLNSQDRVFMVEILPYLLLSYRSIELSECEKEAVRRDFSMTWKRKEYLLARDMAEDLSNLYDIQLDDIEISLVAMLLLSFRKDKDSHLESQDYSEMRVTLDFFLSQIEAQRSLTFVHRNDLLRKLLMHCKALIYRKTYGILSVNPLTKYIKERYQSLFQITKTHIGILEEAWELTMTDDDIAYITIHLGGELEKNAPAEPAKRKIILVCDEGVGVQKLLLNQCEQYLTNCTIEAVFTSEQFYSVRDLVATDLVVSTSDALETHFPVIVVHPILDNEDIIELVRFAKGMGKTVETQFSTELEKCLQAYLPEEKNRQALKAQIEEIVSRILSM